MQASPKGIRVRTAGSVNERETRTEAKMIVFPAGLRSVWTRLPRSGRISTRPWCQRSRRPWWATPRSGRISVCVRLSPDALFRMRGAWYVATGGRVRLYGLTVAHVCASGRPLSCLPRVPCHPPVLGPFPGFFPGRHSETSGIDTHFLSSSGGGEGSRLRRWRNCHSVGRKRHPERAFTVAWQATNCVKHYNLSRCRPERKAGKGPKTGGYGNGFALPTDRHIVV